MPDIFNRNNGAKKDELVEPMPSNHIYMFSDFCTNPLGISFIEQEPNEKILLILRRHFSTNTLWIFITFILLLSPVFFFIFRNEFQLLEVVDLPVRFILIFTIFYYLVVFSYAFINFITWFYNVFLVTQKRVVDIDYSDIVIHNIAFTKLTHMQDVNYTQAGFIHSLLDYGNVFLQTAGTETNFEALSVPRPRKAAHIIANLIGKEAHAV